jgi:Tol biopolymer transport system component
MRVPPVFSAIVLSLSLFRSGQSADQTAVPSRQLNLIVFCSDRSGPWHIWTVRPDGSDLREITKGNEQENDVDPVVDPGGTQVLFSSTRGGRAGVWRMAIDGTAMERVCDGDQAEWSPQGDMLALRHEDKIVVRDLKSGSQRTVSPERLPHCSGPAWSPDGRELAFAGRTDGANALYRVAVHGGEAVPVYNRKGACEPHWSPDGTRLVYETETQICTIQPDGKKNQVVTFFGGVQRYGRYSPDGKWIVFCQGSSERGPWELYKIPVAGGTPVRITEAGSDMFPDWR